MVQLKIKRTALLTRGVEMDGTEDDGEKSGDRNTYYSRRGWTPPEIPIAYQISRQDLVILMTVCSQVRFLVTGQSREYGNVGPTDVASTITQDILDIEHIIKTGGSKSPPPGSMAGVPKIVVTKKGAHSPIEDKKETPLPPTRPTLPIEEKNNDDDDDDLCVIY